MASITSERENSMQAFQQLVVDAVELAGTISPALRAQLISILGATFPTKILPTISPQEASLPAVLRMLVHARCEADRVSTLKSARQPLDTCVAVLIDRTNDSQVSAEKNIIN